MAYEYQFEQIGLTADIVALSVREGEAHTVLVKRRNDPYGGRWALPGGYIEIDELFEEAARREFREETGLDQGPLRFFGFFDAVDRDPRRRVATVAFYAPFRDMPRPSAGDDAQSCQWAALCEVGELAFDHDLIVETALRQVRRDIFTSGVLPLFLPSEFRRSELAGVLAALTDSEEPVPEMVDSLVRSGVVVEKGDLQRFASSDPGHWARALVTFADVFLE